MALQIGYYSIQFHFPSLSCLVTNEISQTKSSVDRFSKSAKGPPLPFLYSTQNNGLQIFYYLLPLPHQVFHKIVKIQFFIITLKRGGLVRARLTKSKTVLSSKIMKACRVSNEHRAIYLGHVQPQY